LKTRLKILGCLAIGTIINSKTVKESISEKERCIDENREYKKLTREISKISPVWSPNKC
jgi:hypothetical protein